MLNILLRHERPVLYGSDYLKSKDGCISSSMQEEGLKMLRDCKRHAEEIGVQQFAAIATEVFRKAKNGEEYINRIQEEVGIPVTVLTQELEAEVGYRTVKSFDENIKVVWDSGASSFQFITLNEDSQRSDNQDSNDKNLLLYMGAFGTSVSNGLFVKNVRGERLRSAQTLNPITENECEKLIAEITQRLPPAPKWIGEVEVVGVAGVRNSIFKVCCDVMTMRPHLEGNGQKQTCDIYNTFSLDDAVSALQACLNHDNKYLEQYVFFPYAESPNTIVPMLSLLVAVMKHTAVKRVQTFPCVGSCPGVLTDEKYW